MSGVGPAGVQRTSHLLCERRTPGSFGSPGQSRAGRNVATLQLSCSRTAAVMLLWVEFAVCDSPCALCVTHSTVMTPPHYRTLPEMSSWLEEGPEAGPNFGVLGVLDSMVLWLPQASARAQQHAIQLRYLSHCLTGRHQHEQQLCCFAATAPHGTLPSHHMITGPQTTAQTSAAHAGCTPSKLQGAAVCLRSNRQNGRPRCCLCLSCCRLPAVCPGPALQTPQGSLPQQP